MRRSLLILAILAAPSLALASPAETFRGTWMYRGPDNRAPRVQSIPGHAEIDVQSCGRRWCYASWRNIQGFVHANALTFGQYGAPFGEPPPPPPDPIFRTWGWSTGFGIGNGW